MVDTLRPSADGSQQTIGIPVRARTADRSSAATSNTAVTVAYAAHTQKGYAIGQVFWSYTNTPSGGKLTIESGSDLVFDHDIIAGGPNFVTFTPPLLTGNNEAVSITLAAAANVTGKVNCRVWQL